jgi:hypothetical protein
MSVVRTSKLSTNAAAIHYKVPRMNLRVYLADNKQSKSKVGRKTVLSPQQEKESSKELLGQLKLGAP